VTEEIPAEQPGPSADPPPKSIGLQVGVLVSAVGALLISSASFMVNWRNENQSFETTLHSAIVNECVKISGEIITLRALANKRPQRVASLAVSPEDPMPASVDSIKNRIDQSLLTISILAGRGVTLGFEEADLVRLFAQSRDVQIAFSSPQPAAETRSLEAPADRAPSGSAPRIGEALFAFDGDRPAQMADAGSSERTLGDMAPGQAGPAAGVGSASVARATDRLVENITNFCSGLTRSRPRV
jgi:hypothetical protein